jgi:nitroimidazol reductase NimA-like FMN-containing flavoprotein (pyridoxamine 5'-phosphate oxidase superfamily)
MIYDLNKAQMERLLESQAVGRLGVCADGRTYVVPLCYVYRDGSIIGHSGHGMKVEMMRENPSVCFEVDEVTDLANWRSVIVWGRFEELRGEPAKSALSLLVTRLSPLIPGGSQDDTPHDGKDAASTRHILSRSSRHGVVFRIVVDEMTGRSEKR